jgi:uncharacterized SAM-binding protein YcdF (DUF218 family)
LSRKRLFLLTLVLAVVVLFAAKNIIFLSAGNFLVRDERPHAAQAAIVLAGDTRGARVLKGAELVRSGYVPKVLVSGPMQWYGVNEADLAIDFAVSKGYPRDYFEPLYIRALSTEEETHAYVPELQKRNLTNVLVVTSNYHTRRTYEKVRAAFPSSIQATMIAAPDLYFSPNTWWHAREGQKVFFYEATKTIAEWVGL